MRPGTGAAAFSRHAQNAAAFGDVLAGEDFDKGTETTPTYASSTSLVNTSASTQSFRPPSAAQPVAGGQAPMQRTIARGAPLFSAPRIENAWGEPSGPTMSAGGAYRPPSGAEFRSTASAAHVRPGSSGTGMLADALRERERRTVAEAAAVYDPTAQIAAEREREASRGVYATPYDHAAAESRNSREPSREQAGSERSTSGTSPTADLMSMGAGKAAGSSGSEPMPVAPLMSAPILPDPRTLEVSSAALDLSDIRRFLTSPVPKAAGIVQCYIDRDKSGISNKLYPMYSLSFKDRFLLAGKKRTYNKTSNYLITMDKRDLNRESPAFLGKLRSNLVGTEYVVFDDGEAMDGKAPGSTAAELRQELGVVCYASNVLGTRGPRKMKVAVPKVLPEGKRVLFQPDREDDSMLAKFKAGYIQDMFLMINKPPKWNEQVGAYVLNFNGRVTMASVKNFQLVSPDDHETVVLQFGRTGKETFSMDFQWPLSPLQAFAICLSSFDYKLACE